MVVVAQLVRVAVCGAAGRRFEPGQPPLIKNLEDIQGFFVSKNFIYCKFEKINQSFENAAFQVYRKPNTI